MLWLCESYCQSYSYFPRKPTFELLVKLVLVTHHFQSHYSCCNVLIVCSFNRLNFFIYVIWLPLKPTLHPFGITQKQHHYQSHYRKKQNSSSFLLHRKMDTNMNEDNNNQEPNAASRMRQAGFDPAVQVVSHVRTTGKPYFDLLLLVGVIWNLWVISSIGYVGCKVSIGAQDKVRHIPILLALIFHLLICHNFLDFVVMCYLMFSNLQLTFCGSFILPQFTFPHKLATFCVLSISQALIHSSWTFLYFCHKFKSTQCWTKSNVPK